MARTQINRNSKSPSETASPATRQSVGDWIFLKFGRLGAKVIHRGAAFALRGVVLFFDYLLVLFTAVNVLPNVAALVQQGTGVTLEMRVDAVIAGWLIPVLFIAAAILVGEVFIMGRLWRFASRMIGKAEQSLFRLDAAESAAPVRGKSTPKNRQIKIAAVS